MSERILVVDDDDDVLVAAKLLLKHHFGEVVVTNEPEQIPGLLARSSFDVILLDMNFSAGEQSGQEGIHWLKAVFKVDPDAVVVLITAYSAVESAVKAMKLGATDFVTKPWQNEKLVATVRAALALRRSRGETANLRRKQRELAAHSAGPHELMAGDSAPMQAVFDVIKKAAPTEANVLILGENGTGKELVAREIHRQSKRANGVFMSVDLGALTEALAASELFGHKKGAFTGADEDRIGRFAAASGGTLFLDEIGNIPRQLQAKLLTVLERREVVPVGTNQARPIDVRILSATNLTKQELADESIFREDLFYRLNTVELTLPPLRQRAGDVLLLADQFIQIYARKYGRTVCAIDAKASAAISAHPWPGNVRALRHAVERAVILSDGETLTLGDFSLASPSRPEERRCEGEPATTLANLEKGAIADSLRRHAGNISHAARELGLTRTSLYRRMEKHGL